MLGAPHPTAIYTLDHRHAELSSSAARDLRTSLETWARGCRIVESPPLFKLRCARAPEGEEDSEAMPATLALVRDLDEVVYLVGCPVLDDERLRRLEREQEKEENGRTPDPELEADLRDCADVEAGRTFSVEVEDDEMRAVIRGRQLRLWVHRVQPRAKTTSTPYDAPRSRGSLGHAGPPTTSEPAPLNPVQEPNWAPPAEPRSLSRPRPVKASLREPGLARTSLKAGRLRITCGAADAEIWLDGAFMGAAPIDTPLPAGTHTVVARRGRGEWTAELELQAGESETIDPCKGR